MIFAVLCKGVSQKTFAANDYKQQGFQVSVFGPPPDTPVNPDHDIQCQTVQEIDATHKRLESIPGAYLSADANSDVYLVVAYRDGVTESKS